jgi:hypothetical protein
VEEAYAEGGCETASAGLDGGEGFGDVEDVGEYFEEAAARDAHAEAPGSREGFDDSVGAHAPEESVESEGYDGWAGVAEEDLLAEGDLVPVYPGGDGVDFGPEALEGWVGGGMLLEEGVEVGMRTGVFGSKFWGVGWNVGRPQGHGGDEFVEPI